jgi:hypothetical protein
VIISSPGTDDFLRGLHSDVQRALDIMTLWTRLCTALGTAAQDATALLLKQLGGDRRSMANAAALCGLNLSSSSGRPVAALL